MVQRLLQTEFVKFCCVGVVNTAIHASIVIGLVELIGAGSTLANTAAFFVANLFSYVCNAHLTFRSNISIGQYLRFLSSSLAVLVSTVTIAALGEVTGVHYLWTTAFLIVASPLFAFLMVKRFAFGSRA